MPLSADSILERTRLKSHLRRWRVLFVISVFFILYLLGGGNSFVEETVPSSGSYVARITLDGILFENSEQKKSLRRLAQNPNVKAVIIYINSPGGTMTGSEIIYNQLKEIGETKPVVSVIGSLGASGGYMVALAGERIFAQKSSLTGSIGVLLQSAEVTELAEKIGVSLKTFKSSPLKGEPSPLTKLTPQVEHSINESIKDSYYQFVDIVQNNRKLDKVTLAKAVNGRIFTGRQAKKLGLIDAYGDESDAMAWLKNNGQIEQDLKLYDFELTPKKEGLDLLLSIFSGDHSMVSSIKHRGMMAQWQPSIF